MPLFSKKTDQPDKPISAFALKFSRIKFVDKLFFIDHLRTMIHASLSLVESLDILSREMESKKFKYIISKITKDVESGKQLSEVLAIYPKVFPPIYVKMVASGEISGKLDESLAQIVIQMKKTHELVSSIRGAMMYPAVVMSAMAGVGILMTTVILPKLIEIFKEFDAELPLATRILIVIVNFVSNPLYFALTTIGIALFITAFIMGVKRIYRFRRAIHSLNLHLPIFGGVIKQINLARFSLTLSSLLKSTIPIIDAVDITADTCTNLLYQESLHDTAKALKTGQPMSEVLRRYKTLFPPMVTEMVMVGERSGEVEHLLNELSDFYNQEVDKTMKNFTAIIEPLLIVSLGIAVAGVAVAVIMPMYSLANNF